MADTGRPKELGGDRRSHAPVPAGCPLSVEELRLATPAEQEHLAELVEIAESRGVWVVRSAVVAYAYVPGQRTIFLNEPLRYLAALHEFGHALAPDGTSSTTSATSTLSAETAAWRWALSTARRAPTAREMSSITAAIGKDIDKVAEAVRS
jgi:hypothetical protein